MNKIEKLKEIWNEIPNIECQGHCTYSCKNLAFTDLEKEYAELLTNKKLDGCNTCSLFENNKCTVYSNRPTVCRLWGVTEKTRCPHGCKAERILTQEETDEIINKAIVLNYK